MAATVVHGIAGNNELIECTSMWIGRQQYSKTFVPCFFADHCPKTAQIIVGAYSSVGAASGLSSNLEATGSIEPLSFLSYWMKQLKVGS